MSNVSKIKNLPKPEPTLGRMKPGDEGWTVPWAYDRETEMLNEAYSWLGNPVGAATLFVKREEDGSFFLNFTGDSAS